MTKKVNGSNEADVLICRFQGRGDVRVCSF